MWLYCKVKKGGGETGPSNETLDSVTQRGNIAYKPIAVKEPTFTFDYNKTLDNMLIGASIPEGSLGKHNWYIGTSTLKPTTENSAYNMGIGSQTLANNTHGINNIAIGTHALRDIDSTESKPPILGNSYNIAIGSTSLGYHEWSDRNVAIGGQSNVYYADADVKPRTRQNTGVGVGHLLMNLKGNRNTALGTNAGYSLTEGNDNIFIGHYAGQLVTTGSGNLFIGNSAGNYASASDLNNKLSIGMSIRTTDWNKTLDTLVQSTRMTDYRQALISGDFVVREVNINGKFSVTPDKMPNAAGDPSFTKQIVAKPDGTFGWIDTTLPQPTVTATTTTEQTIRLTEDFVAPTNIRETIPGFSINLTQGKVYKIKVIGSYKTGVTTTGGSLGFLLTGDATATITGSVKMNIAVTNVAAPEQLITDVNTVNTTVRSFATSTGVGVINTPHFIKGEVIVECTSSGGLVLQWGSEVANSPATLIKNTILEVREI